MARAMCSYVIHTARYLEMLPGFSPVAGELKYVSMVGHKAQTFGAYESIVRLGDAVEAGELLGMVRSLTGEIAQEVRAVSAGRVAVLQTGVVVHPWQSLVWLVVPVDLPAPPGKGE